MSDEIETNRDEVIDRGMPWYLKEVTIERQHMTGTTYEAIRGKISDDGPTWYLDYGSEVVIDTEVRQQVHLKESDIRAMLNAIHEKQNKRLIGVEQRLRIAMDELEQQGVAISTEQGLALIDAIREGNV